MTKADDLVKVAWLVLSADDFGSSPLVRPVEEAAVGGLVGPVSGRREVVVFPETREAVTSVVGDSVGLVFGKREG